MQLRGELVLEGLAGLSHLQVQFLKQQHAVPEQVVVAMSFHRLLEMCGPLWQLEAERAGMVTTMPQKALPLH